jgi:CMP-N,N'-diacetyllegionaminic acid synthase
MIDLAIIPARAGSKRVPNKNTRLLCDKPLIQWTVEAVEQSRYVKDYVITTDIPEVLTRYKKAVKRPKELCGDDAQIEKVILHLLENMDDSINTLAIIQVTSPLRDAIDINRASFLYKEQKALVSVCPTTSKKRMYDENEKPMEEQTAYNKKTDATCYMRNSAIFIFDRERFKKTKRIIHDDPILYKMLKSDSIDIDTEELAKT